MADEKMTPVTKQSWTNPSVGSVSNGNISNQVNENTKEINELKEEVKELKEELSKITGTPIVTEEPVSTPEVKEETNVDMPFASPFSEAIDESKVEEPTVNNEEVKDILENVKEEVKEEPVEEPKDVPVFDDMLVDDTKERVSVVINRYNTDIEATTKGKGAKYIALSEAQHNKLLSGKINE
jgi:polyhydroxyalkanoate synthesis regulator phasin